MTNFVRVKNKGNARVSLMDASGDSVSIPPRAEMIVERRFVDWQKPPFPVVLLGDVVKTVTTHAPVAAHLSEKEIRDLRAAPVSPVQNPVAETIRTPSASTPSAVAAPRGSTPPAVPDLRAILGKTPSPALPYDESQADTMK